MKYKIKKGYGAYLYCLYGVYLRPEHPRRSERHSYSLYHAQLDRGLFVSYTFAFISVVSRRMDEVVQSDMSLRRDPGFGSARTVFLAQVMEGDWVAKRIRIVGKW